MAELYGHKQVSRAEYIKAVIEERVIGEALDEINTQAHDMFAMTKPQDPTDDEIYEYINEVERDLLNELIKQLTDERDGK